MGVQKRNIIRGKVKGYMTAYGVPAEVMAARMHMSKSSWYERMKNPERLTVRELEELERITHIELIRVYD